MPTVHRATVQIVEKYRVQKIYYGLTQDRYIFRKDQVLRNCAIMAMAICTLYMLRILQYGTKYIH